MRVIDRERERRGDTKEKERFCKHRFKKVPQHMNVSMTMIVGGTGGSLASAAKDDVVSVFHCTTPAVTLFLLRLSSREKVDS